MSDRVEDMSDRVENMSDRSNQQIEIHQAVGVNGKHVVSGKHVVNGKHVVSGKYVVNGKPVNNSPVEEELRQYIEGEIIPKYSSFDAAHREDHVRSVIGQCEKLGKFYDVNHEMLYVAAAYHDLGLVDGREQHHISSGSIVREDKELRRWFSEDELETIAQAVEDHRASSQEPPRDIYGRILAEADRQIDPETIIRRTVQYGFAHYSQMSRREMWSRTFDHLKAKYGDGGYLHLWIPESDNAAKLEELRKVIRDEKLLRPIFDKYYRIEKFGPAVCERFKTDEKYRTGHIRIVAAKPGTEIIGLHTPQMKAFAKEAAARPQWREDLEFVASSAAISPLSHDERIIWGLTVDYVKCDVAERLALIDRFLPYIDNWAICDTFCSNAAWAKKRDARPVVWNYICKKLESPEEFVRRTGIILMLSSFLVDEYVEKCFDAISSMGLKDGEPYYVRMGVAWFLATALAKYEDLTRNFVSSSNLPADIVSLYVRKARESFRTKTVKPLNR